MPQYFGALTFVLMLGMVLIRAGMMNREGLQAIHFGKADKADSLILPFALLYFYTVFATAFGLPMLSTQRFSRSEIASWAGVFVCLTGLALLLWSLVSFGRSFRVGIDAERPEKLITTGVFTFSRNPIYMAFALILLGQFLIFPNWLLLVYAGTGAWLFHPQVLREEASLAHHYGQEYTVATALEGTFERISKDPAVAAFPGVTVLWKDIQVGYVVDEYDDAAPATCSK